MSDARHAARECAQDALGYGTVMDADVVTDPATDGPIVELMLAEAAVTPAIMQLLADRGFALDADRTATRGDPTQTVVVARPGYTAVGKYRGGTDAE
jgi:hypothetical protein